MTCDSTHRISIDNSFPLVTINQAQFNCLKTISSGGCATRALIDMIFDRESFINKNYTQMARQFPDEMSAIRNFVLREYKINVSKFIKSVTAKCHGY